MKKRTMKKRIPKNTPYCNNCPYRKHIKTIKLHRNDNCEYATECEEKCWTKANNSCKIRVYRCEYLGYTDYHEDTLLCEGTKQCNVGQYIKNK